MKKEYIKPVIVFENFSLCTSFAGDCEQPYVGNPSKGSCAVIGSGGISIFGDKMAGICEDQTITDDMYDGFCYNVPLDEKTLFNS